MSNNNVIITKNYPARDKPSIQRDKSNSEEKKCAPLPYSIQLNLLLLKSWRYTSWMENAQKTMRGYMEYLGTCTLEEKQRRIWSPLIRIDNKFKVWIHKTRESIQCSNNIYEIQYWFQSNIQNSSKISDKFQRLL